MTVVFPAALGRVWSALHVPTAPVVFLAAGAVFHLVLCVRERRLPSPLGFLRETFPPHKVIHPTTKVDIAAYTSTKVCRWGVRLGTQVLVVALAGALSGASGLGGRVHLPAGLVLGGAAAAFFLLSDLTDYGSHWLQHRSEFFWEFHKLHHTATFLTPLTAARLHPVGGIMDELSTSLALFVVAGAANLLAPLDPFRMVALSAGVDTTLALLLVRQLQHSRYRIGFGWLEAVFVSPAMHQLHHSALPEHYGKNLGSRLAIWDWLFHTGVRPARGEAIVFGISEADAGAAQTIVDAYLSPLVTLYRRHSAAIRRSSAAIAAMRARTAAPQP